MKTNGSKIMAALLSAVLLGLLPSLLSSAAHAQDADSPVAALKASLAKSQAQLRQYQWMETTVVRMSGDEKSQTQDLCYYGSDGKLVKTPQGAPPPPPKQKRGLKGKMIAKKEGEIKDYMQSVQALIKEYVPPDATKIQAAMSGGNISVTPIVPNSKIRLDIKDYVKAGDLLQIELDVVNSQILKVDVSSYLDDPSDTVTLDVDFSALKDGTSHVAQIDLNGTKESIEVLVTNADYSLRETQ